MSKNYDYIFAGAGMSALSLLCRMMDDSFFDNKQILLIDSNEKKLNDRTWSFWEDEAGYFNDLVYKTWNKIKVKDEQWSKTFDINRYTYKMIRGIDFYTYVFDRISKHSNISFINDHIKEIKSGIKNTVITDSQYYTADIVFNSMFNKAVLKSVKGVPVLYQHFKGYFIKTKDPIQEDVVTFMDFSISQKNTLQFMYVLPFDKNRCLVEHTYFSQHLVSEETYDEALKSYCDKHFGTSGWQINEIEKGIIPMTTAKFNREKAKSIIPIGTQGGFTKASSGYTFYFVQKAADRMINELKKGIRPKKTNTRYNFYDALLLRVLAKDEGYGHKIFCKLFDSTSPELVFTFLNEESSIFQDLEK